MTDMTLWLTSLKLPAIERHYAVAFALRVKRTRHLLEGEPLGWIKGRIDETVSF